MLKNYRFDAFKHVNILQREISYFLALAETLNISKTSENLGIQQSGLSRALQRLESDLGQKLFQRKNNGLSLTLAGEQFLKAVKATQSTWEDAFRLAVESAEIPTGLLKIGFHQSFGQKFFPRIVKAIIEAYPQVEIEAHTLSSAQVTRKVNDQELDMGLVITQIRNPELIQKKIGSDSIAGFQLDPQKKPERILVNPEMQFFTPILRKYGQTKKVIIKDYEIMAETCKSTHSIGILPKSVAEKYSELKQVSGTYAKADVSCICHKGKLSSKAYRKMFETVLKSCLSQN